MGLHLLDSLPLSDALDVFLKQRSRSLHLLVDSIQSSSQSISSGSVVDKAGKRVAKQVWDLLQTVLEAIINTVVTARRIFKNPSHEAPSLIQEALEAMQSAQNTSELAVELRLSTQILLSSLPNSNNFLALPPDIRHFRPFVDLKSPSSSVSQPVLEGRLQIWFEKAIDQLRETTCSLLGKLETIKGVWDVQVSTRIWLSSPDRHMEGKDLHVLQSLVADSYTKRIKEIWKTALENILAAFIENTTSSLAAVADLSDDGRSGPPSLSTFKRLKIN